VLLLRAKGSSVQLGRARRQRARVGRAPFHAKGAAREEGPTVRVPRLGCSERAEVHPLPERNVMHVVVRSYSGQGASELFDLLGEREEDVKELISGVPGFVKYAAFRSGDGGMTVTICQDKAGTDESSQRAATWVKENVTGTVNPPAISEGSTVLDF
jgi:hypothetical protein